MTPSRPGPATSPAHPAPPGVRRPARAVRIGLVIFAVGVVFIAADVLPFFADVHDRPLWLNLACLLAPIGFAVAVGSAVRAGRADQREALRRIAAAGSSADRARDAARPPMAD